MIIRRYLSFFLFIIYIIQPKKLTFYIYYVLFIHKGLALKSNCEVMIMANVKLGYGGRVLKTQMKDVYLGIHITVAKMMKQNNICIAFDTENCEFTFVAVDELSNEKPNFPSFKQTALGKQLLKKFKDVPMKGNDLRFRPYKILMSSEAEKFFKNKNVFWAQGKVNKTKNFDSNVLESENNEDLKGLTSTKDVKNIKSLSEVLAKGTIWCLCPKEMEKRTLAATNPDDVKKLESKEDQKECEVLVSIMKSELAKLDDIPYFKESCELASQS